MAVVLSGENLTIDMVKKECSSGPRRVWIRRKEEPLQSAILLTDEKGDVIIKSGEDESPFQLKGIDEMEFVQNKKRPK